MGCRHSLPKLSVNEINNLQKNRIIVYVKSKVYDVTELVDSHPGGRMCIIKNNGNDCNKDFNFHSKNAQKNWDTYLIGYKKNAS